MNSTTMLVCETPTLPIVVANGEEKKKNAPELATLEASVAFATVQSTTEYSTELPARQIATAPSLEEIESEIAAAAQQRIEAALHDLNETRARIERERNARDAALQAAQERANKTRTELAGLAGERAEIERRAETFLAGDALKATIEKIHLAFNVRQLELEDALALAEADAQEMQTQMQAALISDALELQLAEEYLAQLETAAPEVATNVRLAATAEENLAAALQAVKNGLLHDAEVLLAKAKAGNADPARVAEAEKILAEAQQAKTVHDFVARFNAIGDHPGAVRRIRRLIEEAETTGVANVVTPHANRALETARHAANARYAQARPIADHLASEGFVPVVGDGRIEAWKEISRNGASTRFDARSAAQHGTAWTLDRVMVLRGESWKTETPRVPVTRRELPKRVQNSRWFNHHRAEQSASAQ
ncbi:MAG: hypothetical protein AB1817_15795 [Chloroflexota bacterium]